MKYALPTLLACLLSVSHHVLAGPGIELIPNAGQWEGDFRYKVTGTRADIFLSANSLTYVLADPRNEDLMEAYEHEKSKTEPLLRFHAFRMFLEGAAEVPAVQESGSSDHYYNYFLGNDQGRWKGGLHSFQRVRYASVYEGIDAVFGSQEGHFKYDFIVHPHAAAGKVRLRFEGADRLELRHNRLVIHTSVGEMEELEPYAYQELENGRKAVRAQYVLEGNTVTFRFPDGYDHSRELVIDPVVVFSTYSGSAAMNWGFTATYDAQGNAYAGGIAFSQGYPATVGAFQTNFSGVVDIAISKYNATGTSLIYATYIGGSDADRPHSLIVAPGGHLVMAGHSSSINYPVSNGAYDVSYNGQADLIVTSLDSSGTTLVGSTFVGGSLDDGRNAAPVLVVNYGDESRSEVITDAQGNIYVAAASQSSNFPQVNGSQAGLSGGQDAVVLKLNSNLSALLWSTYLGGGSHDGAYVLALSSQEDKIYVAGGTASTNFPATAGSYQSSFQGNPADGFIASFQNGGSYLRQATTYVGAGSYDQCYGLQTDASDNVYAMGQTRGGFFPVSAGVYSNPGSSQFVIKLNPGLSTPLYSTVFGSGNSNQQNISPTAFLVDRCENVYISGFGSVAGCPITANAIQTVTDNADFYFIVLSKDVQSLYYATYYGAPNSFDHVDGGTSRFDKEGIIYQATCACTPSFPVTPGCYSPTNGSSSCNTTCTKINFELTGPTASFTTSPGVRGCAPFEVLFTNTSTAATVFEWDFGDATTSNQVSPVHTYPGYGVYTVRLIAFDPATTSCAGRDTAYVTIRVDTGRNKSKFSYQVLDSCGPYRVAFNNLSVYDSTATSGMEWKFGDNTGSSLTQPGIHLYPDTGVYRVTLIIRDTGNVCTPVDSFVQLIQIRSFSIAADFSPSGPQPCDVREIQFSNGSQSAQSYVWYFGDSGSSTQASPQHAYDSSGVYPVVLVASHPKACNPHDTVVRNIIIRHSPLAAFSVNPFTQIVGEPYQFTNYSQRADKYLWHFGDGETSTEKDPQHAYMRWGQFAVCLIAETDLGCTDTVCKTLSSDLIKAADVPSAFSPNGDGSNDEFRVRGSGIREVDFKIYNRWGQLVFETRDHRKGWDGTIGGRPAEIDAYAYILKVIFLDDTVVQRQGNVTLLK